jgi:hypothetical protein
METPMQDFDLYTGKQNNIYSPRFDTVDPEYFARMNDMVHRDETHSRARSSRLIAFVIGLSIISFTAGLVIGIKFIGGSDKPLVDPRTQKAVSDLGQKVAAIADVQQQPAVETDPADLGAPTQVKNAYPKAEYPFVIRVGNEFTKDKAGEFGSYLSGKGNQVIIARSDTGYRVYAGPYRSMESAEISLQKIRGYTDNRWQNNAIILKR